MYLEPRKTQNNTENTFVTPVFNGSTSLRNAAGQMIEEVTKAVQRKKTVDSTYIKDMYEEMISLHRLEGTTFGALPSGAILLLTVLGATWLGIGGYLLFGFLKKRKNSR